MTATPSRLIIDMESLISRRSQAGFGSKCPICHLNITDRFFVSKAKRNKRAYYHILCALKVHIIYQEDLLARQLKRGPAA